MQKKTTLRTDEFELDGELDFDNFGLQEIDSQINPEVRKGSKSRNAITDVFKGAVGGVTDELKNPSFLAKVARNSLPDSYGDVLSAADTVAQTTGSLYDEAVRELKPQLGRIAKKVDRLVPDEQKSLKKFTSKVKNFLGVDEGYQQQSKEQIQDQGVANALAQVFGAEQQANIQAEARDNADNRIRDHIDGKRFESNFGILNSINEASQRVASYTEKVNQAFQKKSLELQYRSYFVQNEMLQISTKYYEVFKNQNEAITKNTALPEYVKITNTERLKEMGRDKLMDKFQNSVFGPGSTIGKMMGRMKDDALDFVKGTKMALESAMMGVDGLEQLKEMNGTLAEAGMAGIGPGQMAGGMAGKWAADKLAGVASKIGKERLEKLKPVKDFGSKASHVLNNLGGAASAMRDSKYFNQEAKEKGGLKGLFARAGDYVLGTAEEKNQDIILDGKGGLEGASLGGAFDVQTQRSIVEVIPGFLSRILKEITVLRTGNEDTELTVFDMKTGKFVTKGNMGKSILKSLGAKSKESGYDYKLGNAAKVLDEKADPEHKVKLKKFFSDLSKESNVKTTPEGLMKTEAFSKLDKKTQHRIRNKLNSSITDNDDKYTNQAVLTKSIKDVKGSTVNIVKEIQDLIKGGYAEILAEYGLITIQEDGKYKIEEDAYFDFIQQTGIIKDEEESRLAAATYQTQTEETKKAQARARRNGTAPNSDTQATSDRNAKKGIKTTNKQAILNKLSSKAKMGSAALQSAMPQRFAKSDITTKEDIKPMNPKGALSAIKDTKIFNWFYKKGEGDSQEHTGPMAQDVKRTMGEDAAPGGTKLDLVTMNGNNMAAIQALSDKQDASLGGEKETVSILQGIKADTLAIFELLKASGTRTSKGNSDPKQSGQTEQADSKSSDKSYTDILGSMFGGLGTLIGKGSKDLFDAGKKTTGIAAKGVKAGAAGLNAVYDKAKDPAKNALSWVMNKASEVSIRALELGQDAITNKLPAGIKQAKVFLDWAKDKGKELFSIARDVYIKGQESPVIKAQLLKAGYYRDQATGKVIRTMGDLKKLKGNVVNAAGEVILTIEDAAKGLFDSSGQKIKTGFEKLSNWALAAGLKGIGRGAKFLKGALKTGQGLLDKGSDLLSKMPDMLGGFGFGTGKIYDVLVEMRDIMKNKNPPEHEDKQKFKDDFVGPIPQSLGNKIKDKAKNLAGAVGETASKKLERYKQKKADEKNQKEQLTDKQLTRAKRKAKEANDKLAKSKQQGLSEASTGKLTEDKKPSLFNKAMSLVDTAKEKAIKRLEDFKAKEEAAADKKKEPLKADLNPKYRSSTNIVDTIIDKSKGVYSAIKNKGVKGAAVDAIGSLFGKTQEEPKVQEPSSITETSKQSITQKVKNGFSKIKDKFVKPSALPKVETQDDKGLATASKGKTLKNAFSKVKGLSTKIKGAKGAAIGAIGSLFNKDAEESKPQETAKKQEEKTTSTQEDNKPLSKKEQAKANKKAKADKKANKAKLLSQKEPAFNDKDGSGKRDGDWRDELARKEEAAQARKKDPLAADTKAKYRSDQNIIDTMMDKASGVFDFIKNGVGGIFGTAMDFLGMGGKGILGKLGGLIKAPFKAIGAVGKGAVGLARTVGTPLVRGAQALSNVRGVATLVRGAGMIRNVALAGSLLTGGVGSAIMGTIGVGLSAIGSILASPVVLGALAVGAVGYGAYKLFKYATRDNVNEFEAIRMAQYGLTPNTKNFNHFVLGLEEYLCDGRIGYDQGKAFILEKKVDNKELIGIFGIDENDTENCEKFAKWYSARFRPFFLTHLTALYSVDSKASLSKVTALKIPEQIKFLNLIGFDGGPYNVTTSPFKELPELASGSELALGLIKNLTAKLTKENTKGAKDDKKAVAKALTDTTVKQEKPKAPTDTKSLNAPTAQALPKTDKVPEPKGAKNLEKALNAEPPMEGEGKAPAETSVKDAGSGSASSVGKLKVADGPLKDGSTRSQYLKFGPGVSLDSANPAVVKNLNAMAQEYGELTGKTINLNSGSRTTAEQTILHKKDPKKAARPGYSLHEFGLAVDANSADLNALEDVGLMRKYGFTRPVGGEPWHMEPAGIQANISQAKKDPDFAQQAVEASLFKGGGGVGTMTNVPLGKRNPEVAVALLESQSETTVKTSDIKTDKDKANSVLQPSPKLSLVQNTGAKTETTTAAASKKDTGGQSNKVASKDTGSIATAMNQQKYSKKDTLPPITQKPANDPKASMPVNEDGETKPPTLVTAQQNTGAITGPIDPNNKEQVKQAIAQISKQQGIDPNETMTIAAVESSLNPNAKSNSSTATGLFQFTRDTWDEQISKNGKRLGLGTDVSPTDVKASTLMATEYFKSNKRSLSSVKADPNLTDVYLAHFLGVNGAKKFLSASADTIASEVNPKAAKSNPEIFTDKGKPLTISEVYSKINTKISKAAKDFGITDIVSTTFAGAKAANAPVMTASNTATTSASTVDKTTAPTKNALSVNKPVLTAANASDDLAMKASYVPPEVAAAKKPSNFFGGKQETILSSSQSNTLSQSSQTGTATFDSLDGTLVKQLDIQTEMRDLLKQIAGSMDPAKFQELIKGSKGLGEMAVGTPKEPSRGVSGGPRGKQIVASAIDLSRKIA